MTWIGRTRDEHLGYSVALSQASARDGDWIGWVRFDRDEGLWRAHCRGSRCHELGQASTRPGAAEHVRSHYLVQHR